MIECKPCTCGEQRHLYPLKLGWLAGYCIYCPYCYEYGPFRNTEEEAVQGWNEMIERIGGSE